MATPLHAVRGVISGTFHRYSPRALLQPRSISKALLHYRRDDQSLFGQLVSSIDAGHIDPGALRRIFRRWLLLGLEEQTFQLHQFLADQKEPAALLEQWAQQRCHERLVPADVAEEERHLFLNDFQIVAAVVYSDLQPDTANPDLVFDR